MAAAAPHLKEGRVDDAMSTLVHMIGLGLARDLDKEMNPTDWWGLIGFFLILGGFVFIIYVRIWGGG